MGVDVGDSLISRITATECSQEDVMAPMVAYSALQIIMPTECGQEKVMAHYAY